MPSPTKTTLFSIKTSRSPELLSTAAKQNFYIFHPDETSGAFYDAVEIKEPEETVREVMEATAETFSPLDKDGIIAINSAMYDFAMGNLPRKGELVYSEVNTIIGTLTAINSGNKIILWDNLFYQTISNQDPYVREAILYLLIANHLKENFASIPTDNDGIRDWANARVVMPKELFAIEQSYHTATTSVVDMPEPELAKKYVISAEASLKAELAAIALKEIEILEKAYLAAQKQAEAAYVVTYNEDLIDAIDVATKVTIVDQFSNFSFTDFENPFTIPAYTWAPEEQINEAAIEAGTTEYSFFVLDNNDLLADSTYVDVKKDISNFIRSNLQKTFISTNFNLESMDVNGTSIPTCSLENRYNQKYSYYFKAVKKADDKYAIILSVDTKIDCIKLLSATLTCGTEYTSHSYTSTNGVVTVVFANDSHVDIDDVNSTIATSGELKFNNGLILSWSQLLDMSDGSYGIMTEGSNLAGNASVFIPSGFGLTRIGLAEYKKVEQYLCCYVPGEVSHIENVMAREYKERSTRRLRRSEESVTSSSETESENQTDTSSTSRFDMQKEAAVVVQDSYNSTRNQSFHAGANAGYDSGAYNTSLDLSYDTGSSFAVNSSKQQNNRDSITVAKDVVEKTLKRVVSKVKEERVRRIVEEFEEQNRHGFDNRLGATHISGVYRWIDSKYNNELHNYGKRLQYEFMIPEPSAFHFIAKASGVSSGTEIPLIQPLDPRKDQFGSLSPLKSSASITEDNYHLWAAAYNAIVTPPPPKIQVMGKSFKMPDDGQPWYLGNKSVTEDITIPEGYGLNKAYISAIGERGDVAGRYYVAIGDNTREYWSGNVPKQLFLEDNENLELDKYVGSVPVGVQYILIKVGLVTLTLELIRKQETYANWQLETFNAIMDAYETKLQEYKDSVAEMQAKKSGSMKDNPAYYREIENMVLRKNCMSYLIGHINMGKSFVAGSETKEFNVKINEEMDKYASSVKFLEQAFEWSIMSYIFYPFYWAGSEKWTRLYNFDNEDKLFKSFLQAGMARVIVTVRPGFEETVMHYMETGQIWNGSEVPVIGDDLYLSIIEELKVPEYTIDEIWETKVPTSLTIIQADSISLDASGLPCWCDTEIPPSESISNDPNSLLNLEVFIEGYTSPEA